MSFQSNNKRKGWLHKGLPYAINIAIMLLIDYQLATLAYSLFGENSSDAQKAALINNTVLMEPVNSETTRWGQIIAGYHLFGEATADFAAIETVAEIQPAKAPITALNLSLRGIIANGEDQSSQAIIMDNSTNREKKFVPGKTVFNQAILTKIYPDRVLLQHNGSIETLYFEPVTEITGMPDIPANTRAKQSNPDTLINFLSRAITQSDTPVDNIMQLKPDYKRKKMVGYRISAIGQLGRDMLGIAGLQNGDQITAINGIRFANGGVENTLAALQSTNTVELEIYRKNTIHFISLKTAVTPDEQTKQESYSWYGDSPN
ncbi:MAG: type II secretion system protein N [Gammaproteobacteria bacterium]